ncbi:MAG TPA: pyrroline-5-carboxylate reductase [Chloroflexota bacterium]|nr:pyrroline-5-carboxylate reductase [Chloroflexota bacterium]
MSPSSAPQLALIGGGVMGGTIAARVIEIGLFPAARVTISDPDASIAGRLEQRLGKGAAPAVINDHVAAIEGASTVLLATKPQIIPDVAKALRGYLAPDQLVMSIAAGVEIQTIQQGLQHDAIIRVMPNTPAQVGQGISAWIATAAVSEAQKAEARGILGAIGREIEVSREREIDMVTAVSGSGPAWVMLMVEAMIDAGVQIGLRPDWARELALQTMAGSAELMRETGMHPAQLRNMVTTPAGTTAAGLYAMEKGGLRAAIMSGIAAAYERSVELGAAARK